MEWLLILVFGAVLAAALTMGRTFDRRRDPAQLRLQALVHGLKTASPEKSATPNTQHPTFGTGHRRARGLQLELLRAGLKLRPWEYRAATALAAAAMGALGLVMPAPLVSTPVLALAGLCLPLVILRTLQGARVKRFEGQLADALTLIASSLRSGYSFLRAIQVVAQEMPDPMAEEFRWVVAESNLGVPTEQALAHMVERVASYDLELVVTAVNIQLQVGGNLAQILDTIAGTIRERVKNQREIAALTAEGKLSGIICAAMPPVMALFLGVVNPDYLMPLLREPLGLFGLALAGALQCMGILWTRAIVRIDV